ncbi:MAG: hypothetical protein SVR94_09520 [Pseudomonadota bacterium]|nr:hypothetical protein [Pseudomonadota bacterium]
MNAIIKAKFKPRLQKDPAATTAEKIIRQIKNITTNSRSLTITDYSPASQTAEKIISQVMSQAITERANYSWYQEEIGFMNNY